MSEDLFSFGLVLARVPPRRRASPSARMSARGEKRPPAPPHECPPTTTRPRQPAGVLAYRLRPRHSDHAIVTIVATPKTAARRGAGMAAAAIVENELRDIGVQRVYAPAAAAHGISAYFWIRLGYRPLLRAAWPCERAGVAWLSREIAP